MQKAKVFWSGRSQAVRLPKEFRFDTKEVAIRREGDVVILEPLKSSAEDPWAWLKELKGFSEDAIAAMEEEVPWGPDDPESTLFD
jgi:antitoxin VapB